MVKLNNFWKALRLSWFRRHINSKATWAKLHNFETSPNTFNPISSNYESLNKARMQCKNKFWKELYSSLITCRLNILKKYLEEFIFIPINGEPLITKNKIAIKQDWAKTEIVNSNGGLTNWENLNGDKRPLYFEFEEIKRTLTDFVEMSSSKGQGMASGWLAKIRRTIHHYNI